MNSHTSWVERKGTSPPMMEALITGIIFGARVVSLQKQRFWRSSDGEPQTARSQGLHRAPGPVLSSAHTQNCLAERILPRQKLLQ